MPVYTGKLPPLSKELFERVVNREKWQAQDMVRKVPRLHEKMNTVLMTYTGTEPCYTLGECSRAMMEIQRYHVRYHNRNDVPYNFVLGGDNRIYNARTFLWVCPMPPEFKGRHRDTIVIARIGPKQEDQAQQELDFAAGYDLCDWASEFGLLTKDYQVHIIPQDWNVYKNEDPD